MGSFMGDAALFLGHPSPVAGHGALLLGRWGSFLGIQSSFTGDKGLLNAPAAAPWRSEPGRRPQCWRRRTSGAPGAGSVARWSARRAAPASRALPPPQHTHTHTHTRTHTHTTLGRVGGGSRGSGLRLRVEALGLRAMVGSMGSSCVARSCPSRPGGREGFEGRQTNTRARQTLVLLATQPSACTSWQYLLAVPVGASSCSSLFRQTPARAGAARGGAWCTQRRAGGARGNQRRRAAYAGTACAATN